MIWFIKDANAENAILSTGFYVQWLVIGLTVAQVVYMKEAKIKESQAMLILGKEIAPIALVVCGVLYLATLITEQRHGKDDK